MSRSGPETSARILGGPCIDGTASHVSVGIAYKHSLTVSNRVATRISNFGLPVTKEFSRIVGKVGKAVQLSTVWEAVSGTSRESVGEMMLDQLVPQAEDGLADLNVVAHVSNTGTHFTLEPKMDYVGVEIEICGAANKRQFFDLHIKPKVEFIPGMEFIAKGLWNFAHWLMPVSVQKRVGEQVQHQLVEKLPATLVESLSKKGVAKPWVCVWPGRMSGAESFLSSMGDTTWCPRP